MSFAGGAVRTVSGIAEVTTSSIGALGGAAVGSVVGGVRGAVSGVAHGTRQGLERGSHSTPAAIATMAAAGAIGLVDWPVVLTVGGAALVLKQLHERGAPAAQSTAPPKTTSRPASKTPSEETAEKKPVGKGSAARKSSPSKSTTPRPRGRATR